MSNSPFELVTADVEALTDEAYRKGYEKGMLDGGAAGFTEGYKESIGDIIERLSTISDENSGKDFSECLAILRAMQGG